MTPSRVSTTRCPKCQTTFRVTQTQLRAAGGSVRCGSCLNIFDATVVPSADDSPDSSGKAEKKTQRKNLPATESRETGTKPAAQAVRGTPEQPLATILNKLDKEQVEIHQERRPQRKKTRKKQAPEIIIALIACLTLAAQFIWFNKDELSLNRAYRPYFKALCNQFNCTLPPMVNISEIQSSQLLVRIHPDIPEMMIVDAVIVNNASHPQPWPKLSLAFTDLHNQPVASRTFRPSEYLGGELAGSQEMPANQAIRLSLELLDPGPDAVNYRLTFKRKTL